MSLYRCRIDAAVIGAQSYYVVAQTAMIAGKLAQEAWDRQDNYSGSVVEITWVSDTVLVEGL